MLLSSFDRQSSIEDWDETIQLEDTSGVVLWTSVPSDLILTMTLILDVGPNVPSPAASIVAVSTDGTGRIYADVNGFVMILVGSDELTALAPDADGVDKRYRVYIKSQVAGITQELLLGILPIFLGH